MAPTIEFGREVLRSSESSLSREWLETNGIGGFASSTIWGMNTRRYHGLLMAATRPPVGRMLLLSKFEETVAFDGRRFDLSTNRYPGVLHPQGFEYLIKFQLDPFPLFRYDLDGVCIEKSVFMVRGENTTVVDYRLISGSGCDLEIRPLMAFRDYHNLTHENDLLRGNFHQAAGWVGFKPYESVPALNLAHDGAKIETTGYWYKNLEYDAERERGLDFSEDLYNPFVMRLELKPRSTRSVIVSTTNRTANEAPALRQAEIARRSAIANRAPVQDSLALSLTQAADHFIVDRGRGKTIIAGYHWFGDWGRDTMIALPGIALVTGNYDAARAILSEFANYLDQGMLPNRFPELGETPEYTSVDAGLWFFEAAHAYLAYTHDESFFLRQLYPKLKDILNWYIAGTRFGIRLDSDGLIQAGDAETQLTWMDARVDGRPVTPRHGKPVEVQALWYNALCVLGNLAELAEDRDSQSSYRDMAEHTRASFNDVFWNAERECLYDVVNGDRKDASIRPNQLLGLTLAHPIVDPQRGEKILSAVEKDLLTPLGLRTLAPSDQAYKPHYGGGVASRDSAYHQGTVWPWLMGPFLRAYKRVHGDSPAARDKISAWVANFEKHLIEAGIGHISELADGNYPHQAGGCIAQAWSVGELLRAIVEDVRGIPTPLSEGAAV